MKYVIGVDLGTSSVKTLLVDLQGEIKGEATASYPLIHERPGYSEQNPEEWVNGTIASLQQLLRESGISPEDIEGISFSGQMHGLVLLDEQNNVLRNAILWNDTRTTKECREIEQKLGDGLLKITRNAALEGFTLPKVLWVQKHEPELFARAARFVLPKDYLRYRMTGHIQMEISDAAGTLMLNVPEGKWSEEIVQAFGLPEGFCPPIVGSSEDTGTILPEFAKLSGLSEKTRVFGGGADNACGAVGAGIVREGDAMCSIGTSGVVLTYEEDKNKDFAGKVHFFNHAHPGAFYAMGVTLAAGYSLSWFKDSLAPELSFDEMLKPVADLPPGADGLLFTPYLVGERTPHADSAIRASFIGLSGTHRREHMARAVMEGITFSLAESLELFRQAGINTRRIISIGGGAKNPVWLQMQADIFNTPVVSLKNEQGPAMGAAMMAAVGSGWFDSLKECADKFIAYGKTFEPIPANVAAYTRLFKLYQQVYSATRELNQGLQEFRG
ncbi:xylulokinase [Paenibacillus lutimineralis]|uniref:Xylulose kinase n=1 Tax=Paenibacillus lutimineralis TaxID=2707005 RepID=A0A3S9UT10_9BACL|nr:xylulokinase [Paenibacillus lutimineralis]AZS13458.1 xylulokinase [Paenibacillus lutimineralis]